MADGRSLSKMHLSSLTEPGICFSRAGKGAERKLTKQRIFKSYICSYCRLQSPANQSSCFSPTPFLSLSVLFWIWACRAHTNFVLLGPCEVKVPCLLLGRLCPAIRDWRWGRWRKRIEEEFLSSRKLWHPTHRPSAGITTEGTSSVIPTRYLSCYYVQEGMERNWANSYSSFRSLIKSHFLQEVWKPYRAATMCSHNPFLHYHCIYHTIL